MTTSRDSNLVRNLELVGALTTRLFQTYVDKTCQELSKIVDIPMLYSTVHEFSYQHFANIHLCYFYVKILILLSCGQQISICDFM